MTVDREVEALFDAGAALLLQRPGAELLRAAAALFGRGNPPDEMDLAVADWRDLFFVPSSGRYLPPYESAFREKRLGGAIPADALAAYQAAGFEPASLHMDTLWLPSPRPDHLGVELAFVSALLRCARSQPWGAAGLLQSAACFHARRVAPWAGEYGRALAAAAQSATYRDLGRLLEELAAWGTAASWHHP